MSDWEIFSWFQGARFEQVTRFVEEQGSDHLLGAILWRSAGAFFSPHTEPKAFVNYTGEENFRIRRSDLKPKKLPSILLRRYSSSLTTNVQGASKNRRKIASNELSSQKGPKSISL